MRALAITLLMMAANAEAAGTVIVDGTMNTFAGPIAKSGNTFAIPQGYGKTVGNNLFHSLNQITLAAGETADFQGSPVTNILTRVTGGSTSLIDGTLKSSIPGANLYLMNPKGVVFGPNATLNVSGSFHATSADYLQLGANGRFHADPARPSQQVAVDPTAFGFLAEQPAPVRVLGSALTTPYHANLSLVGGNLQLQNATLFAEGGRIDLAAAGSPGEVVPTPSVLTFSGMARQGTIDVIRTTPFRPVPGQPSWVYTDIGTGGEYPGRDGGEIRLAGKNLNWLGGAMDATTQSSRPNGGIQIQMSEAVFLAPNPQIGIQNLATGAGSVAPVTIRGGTIEVHGGRLALDSFASADAGSLLLSGSRSITLTDGAVVSSSTNAAGAAGAIRLEAPTVTLSNRASIQTLSTSRCAATALCGEGGASTRGRGGEVTVQADVLNLSDGATIWSGSDQSPGRAGDVRLEAREVTMRGGGVYTSATGSGDAGAVTIQADRLQLAQGARIDTATLGAGQGGTIRIAAGSATLQGGAIVTSAQQGSGNAGDITLTGRTLSLLSGPTDSHLSAYTNTTGSGGTITIQATEALTIAGMDEAGSLANRVAAFSTAAGPAGKIVMATPRLTLQDGGRINAESRGEGKGGEVVIAATDLTVTGSRAGCTNLSSCASTLNVGAWSSGEGGGMSLSTSRLNVADGGQILASTLGSGTGGALRLAAREQVVLTGAGSGLFSTSARSGRAGAITVTTPSLTVADQAQISTSGQGSGSAGSIGVGDALLTMTVTGGGAIRSANTGTGDAGSVTLSAREAVTLAGAGQISTESWGGQGGDIALTTPALVVGERGLISASVRGGAGTGGQVTLDLDTLELTGGGGVASSTDGAGSGGVVTIRAPRAVTIAGSGSGVFGKASAGGGGGAIVVATTALSLAEQGRISTSSSGSGQAGDIQVVAEMALLGDGSEIASANLGSGDAGQIALAAAVRAELARGSALTTEARTGRGGRIFLTTPTLLVGERSRISASVLGGASPGGAVSLALSSLTVSGGGMVASSTAGGGPGGMVAVRAREGVVITGSGSGLFGRASAGGAGGEIRVDAPELALQDGGWITTSSSGSGQAGSIRLGGAMARIRLQGGSGVASSNTGTGDAGQVELSALDQLVLTDSAIEARADRGDGGNLTVRVGNRIHLVNSHLSTSVSRGDGKGGNIDIDPIEIIMKNSYIRADAHGGPGGNVIIQAQTLTQDAGSAITASSATNVQGVVTIEAVKVSELESLGPLPTSFIDVSGLMRGRCQARRAGAGSSFGLAGRGGLPLVPGDLLASPGASSRLDREAWRSVPAGGAIIAGAGSFSSTGCL